MYLLFRYILDVLKMHGLSQSLAQKETLVKIHQTGRKSSSATSREYYMQLNKEQVKGLYDKYEIDMEMFNYVIEPYLSYAVNTLPPKYAPKQDQINQWMKFMISNDCLNEDFIGQNWKWVSS